MTRVHMPKRRLSDLVIVRSVIEPRCIIHVLHFPLISADVNMYVNIPSPQFTAPLVARYNVGVSTGLEVVE